MIVDDMLTKKYAEGYDLASGLGTFAEWFDLMAHKKPDLDILEIGAGTGSVTLPTLNILAGKSGEVPRLKSYTFTDISTGFFDTAQELLQPWVDFVSYKKLNIEEDPLGQGFEAESFDVIAASNVLHATRRLDVTLANCFKLLKPGGKIIIGELTWSLDHNGVISGTLPGWWLSEDGRTGGPLMSQTQWDTKLRDAQFSGLETVVAATDSCGNQILSTMVASKPRLAARLPLSVAVVVKPEIDCEIGRAIVSVMENQLRSHNIDLHTVSLAEAALLADNGELQGPDIATICLAEAVTPLFARPSRTFFENTRKIIVKSSAIFWYACNTAADGTAPPEACAISGLFRVAKGENPVLRIYEIHLQTRTIEKISAYGT